MEKVYELLLKMENKKEIELNWICEKEVVYDEEDNQYHDFWGNGVNVFGSSEDSFDELIPLNKKKFDMDVYLARTEDWEYSFSGSTIYEFLKHLSEYPLNLSDLVEKMSIEETEDSLIMEIIEKENE